MKKILHINKPENTYPIARRRLLASVMIFCVTFFTLFILPYLKRRGSSSYFSGQRKSEEYYRRTASDWVGYLAENPIVPIAICLSIVLLYNIFVHVRNNQKRYVREILIDENSISISRTDLYFTEDEIVSIPIKNLKCVIGVSTNRNVKKQKSVKFVDKRNGEIIVLIPLREDTWFNQYSEIRKALLKLDKLGVSHQETNVIFLDSIQDVFFTNN